MLCCAVLWCAGVVLPVLGALPDSLIILTSLSSASQAEAQEAVAVGIGEGRGGGGAGGGGGGGGGRHTWLTRVLKHTKPERRWNSQPYKCADGYEG
jgi:hypothetical protein